jgi:photosystem II stability/assembly factor-like uncharacterized protein
MICVRRLLFTAGLLAAGPGGALAAASAPLAYDLYVCAHLSGQSGVMGRNGAAVRSGLYRSADRETFEHLGPHHIRMFTLTHDPRDVTSLHVAALDGVLRTRDGGRTWRTLTSWDMTEPHAVAFDPRAPDDIYAGLPDGVAVSRDRGATWQRMNAGIRRAYTQTITVDRTRAGRVLAGTELGIYLTEDGARTWRLVQATAKTTYDLRQSPHDPEMFLAVTSADGAFVSGDGGATWRRVRGIGTEQTLHNGDLDVHDARRWAIGGWGAGVKLTEDGGKTWVDRSAGLPNREVWSVAFDPDLPRRLYAAPYLQPLFVSDDLGATWRPLQFEKALVYSLVFVPRR